MALSSTRLLPTIISPLANTLTLPSSPSLLGPVNQFLVKQQETTSLVLRLFSDLEVLPRKFHPEGVKHEICCWCWYTASRDVRFRDFLQVSVAEKEVEEKETEAELTNIETNEIDLLVKLAKAKLPRKAAESQLEEEIRAQNRVFGSMRYLRTFVNGLGFSYGFREDLLYIKLSSSIEEFFLGW